MQKHILQYLTISIIREYFKCGIFCITDGLCKVIGCLNGKDVYTDYGWRSSTCHTCWHIKTGRAAYTRHRSIQCAGSKPLQFNDRTTKGRVYTTFIKFWNQFENACYKSQFGFLPFIFLEILVWCLYILPAGNAQARLACSG